MGAANRQDLDPGGAMDMPVHGKNTLIDLRELLDLLRRTHPTFPYRLALFSEAEGKGRLADTLRTLCPPIGGQTPCNQPCVQQWEDLIDLATVSKRPQTHRCQGGFLGFAIPLASDDNLPACLLGGGVRESQPDTAGIPTIGKKTTPPGESANLPTVTREELRRTAEEIFQLLPQLIDQRLHGLSLKHVTDRLVAIREVTRELGRCPSVDEAVALVTETLVFLFDLPRIIFLLRQPGRQPTVHTTLGVDPASFAVNAGRLQDALASSGEIPLPLSGEELGDFLPGLKNHSALLFPLQEGSQNVGLLAVLDVELHARDQALIELLVSVLTARMLHLRQEEALCQERQVSTRLAGMVGTLAVAGSREKLHQGLLEMAAELANASSGSLMIFDEHDQKLRIAVAKGMSPPLARAMTLSLGEGIAGRVASSGAPLLVNDIERDTRVASPNRPRFRTKSFISMPLRSRERLIGVLNLADRQDGSSFTEDSLKLVMAFAGQVILMLDRIKLLERIGQLEELSVTDPLTGLYNRRFLEARLEEERNRSQRQGKAFSIILADFDFFKQYNDTCGHLAGDKALRKAAAAMRRTAREMDVVVRFGGEEFCLILPGTSKKESLLVAERLRQTIEGEAFPGETSLPLGRLTISLGTSTYPDDGNSIHDLLTAADLALYRAKELGRNRTILYDLTLAKQPPAVINLTERI
jgi:diguanylate cyclase (GGDEF)-like protein